MKKTITYARYFFDYLKHGDLVSIIASVKYVLNKRSHRSDRIIKTSIGTFFCRKNTNDFQFANYYYEWGVKKYLLDHKNEFNLFIDGGACIGSYSILLSSFNIRCIAFEPVPANFTVLEKNIELNNLRSMITSFPLGLGDRNSTEQFTFAPVNTGASHIDIEPNMPHCVAEICTFDSLIGRLNISLSEKIMFKLDIEGMEVEAIMGAAGFIRKYPYITFILEDKHTGQNPIKKILNQLGSFEFGEIDEYNFYAKKIN